MRNLMNSLAVFASAFLVYSTSIAFADNCLQNAANSDLVSELGRRLDGGNGGNSSSAIVSFACLGSQFVVSHVNARGIESTQQIDVSFASDCANYVQKLATKEGKIFGVTLVAVCRGSVLHRFSLNGEGIVALQPRDLSFASDCAEAADRVNAG